MINYRELVYGVNKSYKLVNGKKSTYVNFDNAATTPPFKVVLDDLREFMYDYSSIHRGTGIKSQISSQTYDDSREAIAGFLGIDSNKYSIIFVKNTSEAINKLSYMYYEKNKSKVVLSTVMEHHSNDLPWRKYRIDYVNVNQGGHLIIDDLKNKLEKYYGNVWLVAVTGASNVTGYKNDIHKIAKVCHKYGAKILVDGAQLIPHSNLEMESQDADENIDFVAFSAHKMYAPFGEGALVGLKSEFNKLSPDYSGGGTIDIVGKNFVKWADTPEKDEAGTPNVSGAVALKSSINVLKKIGMKNVEEYEGKLLRYTEENIKHIPGIILYADDAEERIAILPFNIEGMNYETLSKALAFEYGIGVRSGCFCAHMYVRKLLKYDESTAKAMADGKMERPGTVRVSFGLYNTKNEIDYFLYALNKIALQKDKYNKIYSI